MKAGFHYVVKAKLVRYKNADEINFMEIEEAFENESPIEAREAAFNYYQNYIDVLLESKGKKYLSDKQARTELQTFLEGKDAHKIEIEDGFELNFDDSFGNGIGVYLIVDIAKEVKPESLSYKKDDELLIHGIGNIFGIVDVPNCMMTDLDSEYTLYKLFNYDTKNKERQVVFCDSAEWEEGYRDDEPFTYTILETPFDWTAYAKPYWWGEPEESNHEVQKVTKTVEQIIEGGEGNQVEFKPALLYNFKTNMAGISVKGKIATAICAFLNANGGFLFIGLKDNGKPQGLDKDFSLANGKAPKDFFQNEFDQMIEHFLTFSVKSNITGQFYQLEGKDIFIITVQPSKNRAIFVKGQNGKEFWVRGNAGNRQLKDIEELANYCIDRWANGEDKA